MNSIAVTLLLVATAQSPDVVQQIAEQMTAIGAKRVGIVPRALQTDAEGHERIATNLGAQADLKPFELQEKLAEAANSGRFRGQFAVVSHRVMQNAFQNIPDGASLGDLAVLRSIGQATGADVLIVPHGEDAGAEFKWRYDAIRINGDDAGVAARAVEVKTLSGLAYTGASFEARRWVSGKLQPVGLMRDVDQGAPQDVPASELKPQQLHPLLDSQFPYGLRIVVPGREVEHKILNGQIYVGLNVGETYKLQVENRTQLPVLVALYVDGINTVGKIIEQPDSTPYNRMWPLRPPGKAWSIEGYLVSQNTKERKQTFEKFEVANRNESLGAARGFTDSLGMVTAVFFEFVPRPDATRQARGSGALGTKAGESIERNVDWVHGERGKVLGAVTIRYSTEEELLAQAQPVPGPINTGNGAPNKQQASADEPGESVPFPRAKVDAGTAASSSPNVDESVPFPR